MSRLGLLAAGLSCSISLAAHAEAGDLDDPLLDYRIPTPVPVEPAPARLRQFDDSPFELALELGVGTAVGLLGVIGEYNLLDELVLGAGLGLNGHGPVWAVRVRARPLIGVSRVGTLHALFVEVAYSRGEYSGMQPPDLAGACHGGACDTVSVVPEAVSWAQFELGWEARFSSRFTLRTSIGVAKTLNQPDWRCERDGPVVCESGALPPAALFVQSLALGWAF